MSAVNEISADDMPKNETFTREALKTKAADATRQKTIAITRSVDDAAEFLELAHNNNAKAHALPTIQLVGRGQKIIDEFLKSVKTESPDYVVFMSSKAVKLLFDAARSYDDRQQDQNEAASSEKPHDSTYNELKLAVANMAVVAVGPKTRESLESEGIKVNEMPSKTYSSVGVGEVFTMLNAVGRKVIVPRSGASTPFLKELLEKIGLEVVEVYLYDVCAYSDTTRWNDFRSEFAAGMIDGIVFTSASSVRGFVEIMLKDYNPDGLLGKLSNTTVVAIGPFTADELKKAGVTHYETSKVHTVKGAFETLANVLDMN